MKTAVLIALFLGYRVSEEQNEYKDENWFWSDIGDMIHSWDHLMEAAKTCKKYTVENKTDTKLLLKWAEIHDSILDFNKETTVEALEDCINYINENYGN